MIKIGSVGNGKMNLAGKWIKTSGEPESPDQWDLDQRPRRRKERRYQQSRQRNDRKTKQNNEYAFSLNEPKDRLNVWPEVGETETPRGYMMGNSPRQPNDEIDQLISQIASKLVSGSSPLAALAEFITKFQKVTPIKSYTDHINSESYDLLNRMQESNQYFEPTDFARQEELETRPHEQGHDKQESQMSYLGDVFEFLSRWASGLGEVPGLHELHEMVRMKRKQRSKYW